MPPPSARCTSTSNNARCEVRALVSSQTCYYSSLEYGSNFPLRKINFNLHGKLAVLTVLVRSVRLAHCFIAEH